MIVIDCHSDWEVGLLVFNGHRGGRDIKYTMVAWRALQREESSPKSL